ncbi:hypothetical protein EJB05_48016, partial [Eragrostis curvula]
MGQNSFAGPPASGARGQQETGEEGSKDDEPEAASPAPTVVRLQGHGVRRRVGCGAAAARHLDEWRRRMRCEFDWRCAVGD